MAGLAPAAQTLTARQPLMQRARGSPSLALAPLLISLVACGSETRPRDAADVAGCYTFSEPIFQWAANDLPTGLRSRAGRPQPKRRTLLGVIWSTVGSHMEVDVILKRFEQPDEARVMTLGKFEILRLGNVTIGRATYEPGWKWSLHVGPDLGLQRCTVEHVGFVVSGVATAAFDDGRVILLRAGQLFYIPPTPHDRWVVGNESYVSLHFLGAEEYAK